MDETGKVRYLDIRQVFTEGRAMRKALTMLAVVLLLAAAGCQKLNYSETPEVPFGKTWMKGFTGPAYEQDVKVTIDPELCSVSAYLVTDANRKAVEEFLDTAAPGQAPDAKLVLAGKTFKRRDSRQDYVLEAKVPARTAYWLILLGGEKTTKVKVKVVGK